MMSEMNRENVYSQTDGLQKYLTKVFTTMSIGLAITALVAIVGYMNLINGGWMYSLLYNAGSAVSIVSLIAQLGICIALSRGIYTRSISQSKTLFFVYSAITGFTFSVLPITFGVATVFSAFVFASVMFASCAMIGHYTKVDLSKFSSIFMGGLLALVIATIVSMFVPTLRNSLMLSYVGIVLFCGLTAWDMQKIKTFYYQSSGNEQLQGNLAIYGAFDLYLDFINMFLYILRILGSRGSRK